MSGLLTIGTNTRYEASLLNTNLRREQARRGIKYLSIGIFAPLRLSQTHKGNSFRALQGLFENRRSSLANSIIPKYRFHIFQSAETARRKESKNYTIYSRSFRKYLFGKTNNQENFSTIHSSVASRAFAFIGISSFSNSTSIAKEDVLFKMDTFTENAKSFSSFSNKVKTIDFSTHLSPVSAQVNYFLPLTSLYERSGHFKTLDGKIRKHQKVRGKSSMSNIVDSVFSSFCRRQGIHF